MRLSTLSDGRVDTVVRIVRMSQSDQIRNRVHSRVHLSLAPRTRWYLSVSKCLSGGRFLVVGWFGGARSDVTRVSDYIRSPGNGSGWW